MFLIPAIVFLVYEVITEMGILTDIYLGDNMWTFMFKHRIASYVLGFVFWGMAYVLFMKSHFIEAYEPLMKLMGINIKKKKQSMHLKTNNLPPKSNVTKPTVTYSSSISIERDLDKSTTSNV